jgi:hypothetical protein
LLNLNFYKILFIFVVENRATAAAAKERTKGIKHIANQSLLPQYPQTLVTYGLLQKVSNISLISHYYPNTHRR